MAIGLGKCVYLYILKAMGRAATSLSKLADTAREELPSTGNCQSYIVIRVSTCPPTLNIKKCPLVTQPSYKNVLTSRKNVQIKMI
jgi:hypothetical protein